MVRGQEKSKKRSHCKAQGKGKPCPRNRALLHRSVEPGLLPPIHLEPDILECEVKWALGSSAADKTSGGDEIPEELFKILKDDAIKVLHSVRQQIGKTQQWPWDWKRSIFIPIPKKGSTKECSIYQTVALTSHASKLMLKISQARLQQYLNQEILCLEVQAGFRKGRGTRDQIANILWIIEKVREFQKNIYSVSLTMLKPLTVWIITNCGKLLKSWEYKAILPVSQETCTQVKKQQLESYMEQF